MPTTSAVTTGGASRPLELPPEGSDAPSRPAGADAAGVLGRADPARPGVTVQPGAARAATPKAGTTKATARKTASASAAATKGYATRLPADFAFLRDPKLSLEEKLSRFIGLLMAKSEQELLAQMERMAPGSTNVAKPTGGTGSTGSTAPKPKPSKFSLWGLAKAVFPPLGLASQLVGDAKLKALLGQVSGPVLAAAATALGLPQLAPLAAKVGPELVGALTKDGSAEETPRSGGTDQASSGGSSGSAGGSTGGSTGTTSTKAAGADGATSEKVQLMELQRLQDRDKELFTLFSNMLRAMHDARMTAIQNLR